ncbi:MAG: hypothetical protein ACR2GP_07755 [Burkholderiaceae bacterium]
MINSPDALGWIAALLMITTFCCVRTHHLRACALAANLGFIAYGYVGHLLPIVILHMVLLPVNGYRLVQAMRNGDRGTAQALPHVEFATRRARRSLRLKGLRR